MVLNTNISCIVWQEWKLLPTIFIHTTMSMYTGVSVLHYDVDNKPGHAPSYLSPSEGGDDDHIITHIICYHLLITSTLDITWLARPVSRLGITSSS